MNQFTLQEKFPVSPGVIYKAWLDSDGHSAMTGGEAVCSDEINQPFTTWDGYISGRNKELVKNQKIVQSWRTTEFSETDPDSELIIELKETSEGCLLTLNHNNIPEGQSDYKKGWEEHYFNPMREYFSGSK